MPQDASSPLNVPLPDGGLTAASDAASERPLYTPREERANALTHGLGFLASLVVLAAMLSRFGSESLWCTLAFGGGLALMFAASTLYHAIQSPGLKRRLRLLDHASIYLLIAGAYTPYMVLAVPGEDGRLATILIWGMAAVGIAIELFWLNRPKWLIAALYVLLGWCILIKGATIRAAIGDLGLGLLIAGGLSCTLGVAFYVQKRRPYMHAVFHLFILIGTALAWTSVYFHVLPLGA